MANAITTQVINDGQRNVVIKVTIVGDGSGEETKTVLFDASAYTPATTNNNLRRITYLLNGFDAVLYWDATTDVVLMPLDQDLQEDVDFTGENTRYGGIPNNGGAGRTGDILITTTGLGSGDVGYIVLHLNKKDVPKIR